MEIVIKLFASLSDYLPPGAERNVGMLEVNDRVTLEDVIARLKLPRRETHLVLVNGEFVPPSQRRTRRLNPHDAVAIWPPIAGG